MARTALRTEDIKIDQQGPVEDEDDRGGIVRADLSALDKDYAERLAFMEEPVTFEIAPGGGDNPVTEYFCQVNGKNPEVLIDDNWCPFAFPYFPAGERMTTKRKYLEVLARSKTTSVRTEILDKQADNPRNLTHRNTSALANLMIHEDRNPRGVAWLSELRRRNF